MGLRLSEARPVCRSGPGLQPEGPLTKGQELRPAGGPVLQQLQLPCYQQMAPKCPCAREGAFQSPQSQGWQQKAEQEAFLSPQGP